MGKVRHRCPWARGVKLLPVLLALVAIALSSPKSLEAHAAQDQSSIAEVQHTDGGFSLSAMSVTKAGTHCAVSFGCHAPALFTEVQAVLRLLNSFDLAWPDTMFFLHGRTQTVPTPPPLSARV